MVIQVNKSKIPRWLSLTRSHNLTFLLNIREGLQSEGNDVGRDRRAMIRQNVVWDVIGQDGVV